MSGSFESVQWNVCVHLRPQFILSSKRVLGEWSQNPCYLQEKKSPIPEKLSSEEDGTCDAASSRTASPTQFKSFKTFNKKNLQ